MHTSRRARKRLPSIQVRSDGSERSRGHRRLFVWAPHNLSWWIAVLFGVGSALFILGAYLTGFPNAAPQVLADLATVGWIFFVGSVFFTSAAYLQLTEVINGDVTRPDHSAQRWRWFAWRPRNLGYLAAFVQGIGTVLFNINTADAMRAQTNWVETDVLVWGPNMLGSVCFLVASYFAVVEVSHRFWAFRPSDLSWWIAMANLAGSIAFQISALLTFTGPATPNPERLWLANLLTLVGAGYFLVGSYLLIPEMSEGLDAEARSSHV